MFLKNQKSKESIKSDSQPQYGVAVQAIALNKKGLEDNRVVFTTHTSKNGEFEFNNLALLALNIILESW